jgi:hypothetical protein
MIDLILSKFGALIAGIAALASLWIYGKVQKNKAEKERLRAEVAERTVEVKDDQAKRKNEIDKFTDSDITDYFGGVRGETDPSSASASGKASVKEHKKGS